MKGSNRNYEKAKHIADKYRRRLIVETNTSFRVKEKQSRVFGCGLIFLRQGDKGYDEGHRLAMHMCITKKLDSHEHLERLKLRENPKDDDFLEIIVEETSLPVAQSYTDKYRPAPAGVSVGHEHISAGTIGSVVCKGENKYILSNNHILANSNAGNAGDDIRQPGPADGGGDTDKIGELDGGYPAINFAGGDNLVDCALAVPSSEDDISTAIMNYDSEIQGHKDLRGLSWDELPSLVAKVGRTTEFTEGVIVSINYDFDDGISYGFAGVAVFVDQIVIVEKHTGFWFSRGGDSGSIVFDPADMMAVGLLFAGWTNGTGTIANHIQDVVDALGFAFCPGNGAPIGAAVPIGFRSTHGHLLHRIINGVVHICETCCRRPYRRPPPIWSDCNCMNPGYWGLGEAPPFIHVHVNEFKKWIFDDRCNDWLIGGPCSAAPILACRDFIFVRSAAVAGCYYVMGFEWSDQRPDCTGSNAFWHGYYWSDGIGLFPHRTEFEIGCDCCET